MIESIVLVGGLGFGAIVALGGLYLGYIGSENLKEERKERETFNQDYVKLVKSEIDEILSATSMEDEAVIKTALAEFHKYMSDNASDVAYLLSPANPVNKHAMLGLDVVLGELRARCKNALKSKYKLL